LRKDGFGGHAKDIKINGKKAVRVFSGPFVNRSLAEKMKKKLDKKYKVKSLIIYFDA
jgi:DedD protein